MLDKAKVRAVRRNAKRLRPLKDELSLLDLGKAVEGLPGLLTKVSPYLKSGREAFEDVYAGFLRALGNQREALEDFIAERNERARKKRTAPKIYKASE